MVALTGFSKNTCCRIQADFEALEFITVRRLGKGDLARTNFFTINYDVIEAFFENKNGSIINTNMITDNTVKTTTTSHPIVDKWNKIRGEVVSLSKNLLKQVEWVLKEYFDGCVEEMERFFEYVQGADCLSGRSKSGFVAKLHWILRACNLDRALGYWGRRREGKRPPPDVIVPLVPPVTKLQQLVLWEIGEEKYISWFQGAKIDGGRFVFGSNWLKSQVELRFGTQLLHIYTKLGV